MALPTKPKLIISFLPLVVSCLVLSLWVVFPFVYQNRCYVISCEPASWEKILDIALAQTGDDSRIDMITARPPKENHYSELGPTFINISISYVSLKQDYKVDEKINHPVKDVEFDDISLIKTTRNPASWRNYFPSETSQEILKRVTVHPRKTFELTWMLAEKEASLPAEKADVSTILHFNQFKPTDKNYEQCRCESMWSVTYIYDKVIITYFINAQTAQIASIDKESREK
jgi:hypothetical protein